MIAEITLSLMTSDTDDLIFFRWLEADELKEGLKKDRYIDRQNDYGSINISSSHLRMEILSSFDWGEDGFVLLAAAPGWGGLQTGTGLKDPR